MKFMTQVYFTDKEIVHMEFICIKSHNRWNLVQFAQVQKKKNKFYQILCIRLKRSYLYPPIPKVKLTIFIQANKCD